MRDDECELIAAIKIKLAHQYRNWEDFKTGGRKRCIYSTSLPSNAENAPPPSRGTPVTGHATHLVDRSESPRSQDLDPLQLRLLQDPQLSLVGGRSARRQGLHQLAKQKRTR